MTRMIDTLGLDGRKVRSLEALKNRVDVNPRDTVTVSPAQYAALQDACTAAIKAGTADARFIQLAKNLGLKTTV
jgi:hypothetical protein